MEKVPHEDDMELIQRIDQRLKAAAAKHAFTVEALDGMVDVFLWTCTCGEHIIQLEGENVQQRIIEHVQGSQQ